MYRFFISIAIIFLFNPIYKLSVCVYLNRLLFLYLNVAFVILLFSVRELYVGKFELCFVSGL